MLTAVLILFAISVPFMYSASAVYKADSSSPISQTTVFLSPYRISGTAGETINVDANITTVTQMDGYQVGLIWSNTTVANCTGAKLGSIVNQVPSGEYIQEPVTINNTQGLISATGAAAYSPYTMSGSGGLVVFTFYIKHTGYADLHINDMFLTYTNASEIPCNTVDYFTAIQGGKQYIVKLEGNPIEPSGVGGFGAMSVHSISKTIGGLAYKGNMTFEMNGTSDISDFAYFNATIPNSLMSCSSPSNWLVILNGTQQSGVIVNTGAQNTTVSLSTNSDPSFAYSAYSDSGVTLPLNILSTSIGPVPEFASMLSTEILAALMVLTAFAAALFGVKSRSRKLKG